MIAPYECSRTLPDGSFERVWFHGYEAVLLWIYQRLDLDAEVRFNSRPVDRAQLVQDVERFNPATARLEELDALNFLK